MNPDTLIALASLGLMVGDMYLESVKERNQIIQGLNKLKYNLVYAQPSNYKKNAATLRNDLAYFFDAAKSNRAFKSFFCPIKYEANKFSEAAQSFLDSEDQVLYDTMQDEAINFIDAIIEFLK